MSLESLVAGILKEIEENPERDALKRTPERVAKALRYLTEGYSQNLDDVVGSGIFQQEKAGQVIVKDVLFYSLCEHHLLPFLGSCHVGYLPDGKILGLSKVFKLVDMFSRRLQVQEQLTDQIADAMDEVIKPKGVIVVIDARHLCLEMRGKRRTGATILTTASRGLYKDDPDLRREFFTLIGGPVLRDEPSQER